MKITTDLLTGNAVENLKTTWDISFHGPQVDEREKNSSAFAKTNSNHSVSLSYSVIEKQLTIKDEIIEDFSKLGLVLKINAKHRVLLDATTLSVPELFFVIRELKNAGVDEFDACYFEPMVYQRIHEINLPDGLCFIKNYGLSDDFSGYVAIPGAAMELSESKPVNVVFLTGFEAERVCRAFENQNILKSHAYSIVGVPPFVIGMELSNLSNNVKVFSEFTRKGIHYCPANNPYLTYKMIEKIYKSEGKLVVAPVGTKPHGLAAVLFCIRNKNVGLLYDHPEKSEGRSKELGPLSIYHIRGLSMDEIK